MKEKIINDIMKKGANMSHTIDLQRNNMKRNTFSKVFHNFFLSFLFIVTIFFLMFLLVKWNQLISPPPPIHILIH